VGGKGPASVERLTLDEIRVLDRAFDEAAARSPFALTPGVTSADGVAVAGTDGHLFIANGANHWERQYLGEANPPPFWIPAWIELFQRRRAEAAQRGVLLWNVVAPEKQVVLPESRWPAPLPDGEKRPLRLLLAALGNDSPSFYLADALIEARSFGPVYARRNSHWTGSACCYALRQLWRDIGMGELPDDLAFGYRRMATAQDLPPHFFAQPPLEATGILDLAGDYLFEYRPNERGGRRSETRYAVRNADAPDPRRILIFGDSFACDAGIAAFMSAIFRETIFIWSKGVQWDEVERQRADIVLWESAERFLPTIPKI